jgi:hypothetical protein
MPIILGCGGCGLLILLCVIAFFVIGAYGKRAAEHRTGGRAAADTTVVSGDTTPGAAGSDASSDAPAEGAAGDSSSGGTGEAKPSDKPAANTSGDTLPVREMQPLNP